MPSSWNFDSAAPADSPYGPSISLACRCSRGRIVLDGHEAKEGIGSAALFVVISSRKNARPNVGMTHPQEAALPEEMAALHKSLQIQRVVIVTPSVYGTDNSATLYGMKARGADARGVAVIDDKTTEADLDAMGRAGVRGIRLNLATGGTNDPAVARARFQAGLPPLASRNCPDQHY